MEQLVLPKFDYYLDKSDPDIVSLHRQDGAFVAAFSASGAIREGIVEAAKEDYGGLIEVNALLLGLRGDGDRKRALNPGAPLFTRVRGRGVLRSSHIPHYAKLGLHSCKTLPVIIRRRLGLRHGSLQACTSLENERGACAN